MSTSQKRKMKNSNLIFLITLILTTGIWFIFWTNDGQLREIKHLNVATILIVFYSLILFFVLKKFKQHNYQT